MKIFLNLFFILCLALSCKNNSQENKVTEADINERLTKMNVQMVGEESKKIDEFISRHSMKPERTGTGLRFEIYEHASLPNFKEGRQDKGNTPVLHDEVVLNYKIFQLDGTLCYSSDSTGPMKFHLGEGQQVRGLEEAVMMMVPGDKARLVVPSHLAYGISGDEGKIPPASALYYEIELLSKSDH
jgi:FKBP-type peptidyl-prolyl cis-trans isomerase FkpA